MVWTGTGDGALRARGRAWRTGALVLGVSAAACGGLDPSEGGGARPDPRPPTARMDQAELFAADAAAERSSADGAGRAVLVEGPGEVVAGSSATFRLRYTAGAEGIADGGYVAFVPEPYWGWSAPQTVRADLPGYTTVELEAADGGARLEPRVVGAADSGMLLLEVEGGALAAGDTIDLVYGAGVSGARVDRYAGRRARLWFGVDGDGDGVRGIVADSPTVDVVARAPERLVVLGPSVLRPGAVARFHVSALDELANAAAAPGIRVTLEGAPEDWTLPEAVTLDARGHATFEATAGAERPRDAVRLTARATFAGGTNAAATSNPLVVDADGPFVLWGDLHGHTGLSDGTGVPDDYFDYARRTARLDFAALTDHDHFGFRFLDADAEGWDEVKDAVRTAHAAPDFTALLGYEWTSWIHGHRHVLHFADDGPLVSSIGGAETPAALWRALEGLPAMTLAHHSSGQPIPVNWTYPPDPTLEPLTEITSIHGQSEWMNDAPPSAVLGSRAGHFVRDQLDRGTRLGFVGSGDTHDGHPGLGHLSPLVGWRRPASGRIERPGRGGLAAVWSEAPAADRAELLGALRARSTYATSGPRIVCRLEEVGEGGLLLRAHATSRFTRAVEVFGPRRDGSQGSTERVVVLAGNTPTATLRIDLDALERHTYVYVRLEQVDGSAAWVGPWWR